MQPKSLFSWTCTGCSWYHRVPHDRCVNCREMRNATRQEMRDFIQGKPIPEKTLGNVVEILSPPKKTAEKTKTMVVLAPIGNKLTLKRPETSCQNAAQDGPQKQTKPCPPAREDSSSSTHVAAQSSASNTTTKTGQIPPPKRQSSSNNRAPGIGAQKTNQRYSFGTVYQPGPVPLDPNTCNTWIYPIHEDFPTRQYQLEISETAVLYNTLVSLPTGLGKTHIAAVVLFNFYRWFPEGKVLFLAPTLPLVSQQAEACYKIMGIPEIDTAVLTGRLKPSTRFEMWRSRRVFYCTPQTVQKDLDAEEGSSFASKVCCVVLDEAHKASGDYAYTKVIEQLELAGAKFRIVGLSATPGTSIKAIQGVVDALRTYKIEARFDTDDSVAPYIHQKHSEIVIVPRNDSQKDIERRLTRLLDPVLNTLKDQGAMKQGIGNATLTSYQIVLAMKEYQNRNIGNGNGPVLGNFLAAQKLVELRNDARQSLGTVKQKMTRLKQQPQRGVLSTIVKSMGFEDLFQIVLKVNDGTASVERFNPKLQKLGELLNEHFSRAHAADKSSRAIVFSQFRDSVQEIVGQLEVCKPLIRARCFVGQQGSKRSNGEDDNRLGGMKQAEQQEAIKMFREGLYNVLVCTCIGEEGLDIGEVDLIVNFDTLRSPIRMIQRTGRTGRKRDGRVVCLISEGHEEHTYHASKRDEQKLMNALKSKTFKMVTNKPLLPQAPSREDTEIKICGSFRFSQVGHAHRKQTKVRHWNLSAAQEEERSQLLGKVVPVSGDWKNVRMVLLRGWGGSFRAKFKGQSCSILQKLSAMGPVKTTKGSRRSLNCGTELVFPSSRQHRRMVPVEMKSNQWVDNIPAQESTAPKLDTVPASVAEKTPTGPKSLLEKSDLQPETGNSTIQSLTDAKEIFKSDDGDTPQPLFRLPTPQSSSGEEDNDAAEDERSYCFRLPTQDSSSSEEEYSNLAPHSMQAHEQSCDEEAIVNMNHLHPANVQYDAPLISLKRKDHSDTPLISLKKNRSSDAPLSSLRKKDLADTPLISLKKKDNSNVPLSSLRKKDHSDTPLISLKKKENSDLPLSSLKKKDAPLISLKRKAPDRPLIELKRQQRKSRKTNQPDCRTNSMDTSNLESFKKPLEQTENTTNSAITSYSPSVGSMPTTTPSKATSTGLHSLQDTPTPIVSKQLCQHVPSGFLINTFGDANDPSDVLESDASVLRQHQTPSSSVRDTKSLNELTDTPSVQDRTLGPNALNTNGLNDLTDTPDCGVRTNLENIECARCPSGESTDDNPIVLCDGRCNRGFHKFCCSIDVDLDSKDPWLCHDCSKGKGGLPKKIVRKRPIREVHSPVENVEVVRRPVNESEDDHTTLQRKRERLARLQARRLGAERFVLDEADIDADDDLEGDDEENAMLEALEDEENSHDSFINDATQLTQHYSDDELGQADPDASDEFDFHHRNLDAQLDRENQFAAPVLNRVAIGGRCTDVSQTSSQDGLGNMHFIRSVLQHHQQGGRAEEIESYFRNLQAGEHSPGESSMKVDEEDHGSTNGWPK